MLFGGERTGLRKRGKKAAQKSIRKITDAGMNPVLDASALEPQKIKPRHRRGRGTSTEWICVFSKAA